MGAMMGNKEGGTTLPSHTHGEQWQL